jgi:hypothetical protein
MPRTSFESPKYVRVTVSDVFDLSYLMQRLPRLLVLEMGRADASICWTSRPRADCSEKQFLIFVPPWLCSIEAAVGILAIWAEDYNTVYDVEVLPFRQCSLNFL